MEGLANAKAAGTRKSKGFEKNSTPIRLAKISTWLYRSVSRLRHRADYAETLRRHNDHRLVR
jgi:hypothetical protein